MSARDGLRARRQRVLAHVLAARERYTHSSSRRTAWWLLGRQAPTHRCEQRLRFWTAISWLLPTVVALHGAWRGRGASGRQVGRAFSDLPRSYLLAFLVPYVALFFRLWRPLPLRLSPVAGLASSATGAVLSLLGMGLVLWGRVALGRMYNVSSALGNRLYADQELVTSGPFAFVRHPMYVGALIAGVGGLLLYRTWAVVLVLAHEMVFWVRAGKEEQALATEFGDAWRAYARRVPAGVPVLGGPNIHPAPPTRRLSGINEAHV